MIESEKDKIFKGMRQVVRVPLNPLEVLILKRLVDADYRKAEEVRKETLLRLYDIARNSPYSEIELMLLKKLIKEEFGVEADE